MNRSSSPIESDGLRLIAEKKVDLDTDTSGQRYVAPTGIQVGPSHKSDDIQVTLMVSGSSKARLLLKDGKKEIVVVCDGKVVWTLMPDQHAYTEVTARSANIATPVYLHSDFCRQGPQTVAEADVRLGAASD
jgi:outer membrane lipoprotein-sorting protein